MRAYLAAFLAGLFMGVAWCFPLTTLCTVLAWLSLFLLVIAVDKRVKPHGLYLFGVTAHAIGFYWLVGTLQVFGGFPWIAAVGVYLLFVAVSALQFPLVLLISRVIDKRVLAYSLTFPLAWVTVEKVFPRIFPWEPGHTQLQFGLLAQLAEITGTEGITFLMLWVIGVAVGWRGIRDWQRITVVVVMLAALTFGALRIGLWQDDGETLTVQVVQANLSTEEKQNQRSFADNVARYVEITEELPSGKSLIIWPESVVQQGVPAAARQVAEFPLLRSVHHGSPMIVGAFTFDGARRIYNSALGISADGTVEPPYHKQVLMPFGEYMPFEAWFPWLRDLNPMAGNFTRGTGVSVFTLKAAAEVRKSMPSFRVSALICYEDIIPELSREAVRQGAQVLTSLSNDAWFGDTPAPLQHHMIAAFRAIETRRWFIRSTNSGYTAIVSPVGLTVGSLPLFAEGVMTEEVFLHDELSPFVRYWSTWYLPAAFLVLAFISMVVRRVTS